MRRTGLITVAFSLVLMLIVVTSRGQLPEFPQGVRHDQLMDRKLLAVNNAMEGLARADFEQIKQASDQLAALSKDARWNVHTTLEYLQQSEDFRATVTQMKRSAEEKNLDAVGLAYVKLSISCIDCHRYARKKMPRLGGVRRQEASSDNLEPK